MSQRRALMLINPNCRCGDSDLSDVVRRLKAAGIELLEERLGGGDASERIIRRADEVTEVIVGGGDGTLRAAAQGLLETQLPLGILPLGTANDLARTLELPVKPVEAAAVIAEGELRRIDVGVANDVHFFNAAHMGLGTRVTRNLSSELKRRWGILSYARVVARAFRQRSAFSASIECDGREEKVRTIHVAIGNGRHYGGGLTIAEDATIEDGCLHVYSIQPISLWELLLLGRAFRNGFRDEMRGVRLFRGREIRVTTTRPMAVDTDGERTTKTPARFSLAERGVAVWLPRESPNR